MGEEGEEAGRRDFTDILIRFSERTRDGKVSGGASVKLEEAGLDTGVKPPSLLQRLSQRHGGSA